MNNLKLIIVALISLVLIGGGYYISYQNKELKTLRESTLKLEISNDKYKQQLEQQTNQYNHQIELTEQLQNELIKIQSSEDKEVVVINKLSKKHFKKAKLIENLINKGIQENNNELESLINN